ncbi:hypothetical protein TARUN_5932 [Trichoderma arundinaceum]|uniref:BTB domain-containing protein n=1 Tax=Trichoderma arundinaceum TaxID=490622 RepID=A0A395NJN1_TRIAR|nr:hypothetical protein TARUN_5932 [Trichoderma arundinaceum]
MKPTHTIDPSGDTLFILQNANAPFAVLPPSITLQTQQRGLHAAKADEPQISKDKPEVRMRLSSKHLTLASAYFEKLTTSGFKETTPQDGYSYVITAQDWDEEALLAMMNIIHGRTAKVPRIVSLEMLAKLAVLVDYYQCHQTVQFFAETWIHHLKESFPFRFRRDVLLRLTVSWVFSEATTFMTLTKAIILESNEPVDSSGLPIPQAIIDALNQSREDVIAGTISGLHSLKTQFYESDGGCSFECSAIYLGALTKGMSKMNILDPVPKRPFLGHSLLALKQAVCAIKEPSWQSTCPKTYTVPEIPNELFSSRPKAASPFSATRPIARPLFGSSSASPPSAFSVSFKAPSSRVVNLCSISAKTRPIITEQLARANGLVLKDFVKK